jgi:hypothetical protein
MAKSGALFLLIFVLLISLLYWYFISKDECKPMTRCALNSVNISCASDGDCFIGSMQGNCNRTTFKCTNMILNGNEEGCKKAGGEWISWGCIN